jgi:pimeloyl-ACP methyl ester carboxylesterase
MKAYDQIGHLPHCSPDALDTQCRFALPPWRGQCSAQGSKGEFPVMPIARIGGIEHYYQETGTGEALLLINGVGGTSLDWEPMLPALTEHFRVIAYDNRGAGRSDVPPGPYTTRQLADDAAALLAHLDVPRAHVLGFSMGGMIAQELALSYPQLVDRLILYGTFARPRAAIYEPWTMYAEQMAERLDSTSATVGWLPWLFSPAFFADPERIEAALAWQEPYPQTLQGFVAQIEAVRTHDALDRVSNIAASTLVLAGAEDILTPVYYARELAERIPGAELRILDRGGHCALWEYPEAALEAVLSFLTT